MRFTSTAGISPPADLATALLRGLAPDGGLYIPQFIQPLRAADLEALREAELHRTALTVGRTLFASSLDEDTLESVIRDALTFAIPLRELEQGLFVLELFHGPTGAFKDVGARFMARLMAAYRSAADPPLMVLTATSGDTGGAVAHAFTGLTDTQVVILFPAGQVSAIQRRQFTTLGGAVRAIAVEGTFDDCQRLAKQGLASETLRRAYTLTSANSINVGRLLPQVFSYFHGWAQLPEATDRLVVSVPSGNFGNLAAGLMAKRLGLPVHRFVAATNINDVVPEYLRCGTFRVRPSQPTISSAMDVGAPSNFERILALYHGRHAEIARDIRGSVHTDDDTRAAISRVHRRFRYVLDPHSAVGFLGIDTDPVPNNARTCVFLATAHPGKFAEIVEPLIGEPVPLPHRLAVVLEREERIEELAPSLPALERLLLRG